MTDQNSAILRPVPMKYPPQKSPPTEPSQSSLLERLVLAVTGSDTTTARSAPVRVRLINTWQDVTAHRANIIICNFLYDTKLTKADATWKEIEKYSGLRREHYFYTALTLIGVLLLVNKVFATMAVIVTVVVPALCSLQALNEQNGAEDVKYWLQYWVLFAVVIFVEHVLTCVMPDSDFTFLRLLLLGVCLSPYAPILPMAFSQLNGPFLEAQKKFEEYNYQTVA